MSDFQMKIISALRYQSTYFGVHGCLLVADRLPLRIGLGGRSGPLKPEGCRCSEMHS